MNVLCYSKQAGAFIRGSSAVNHLCSPANNPVVPPRTNLKPILTSNSVYNGANLLQITPSLPHLAFCYVTYHIFLYVGKMYSDLSTYLHLPDDSARYFSIYLHT